MPLSGARLAKQNHIMSDKKVLRLPAGGGAATGAGLDCGVTPDQDLATLQIRMKASLCNFEHSGLRRPAFGAAGMHKPRIAPTPEMQ